MRTRQTTRPEVRSGGVGFVGLLTIAFIVLKLTDVIDWSWWWVLSPMWISAAVVAIAMGGLLLYIRRKR